MTLDKTQLTAMTTRQKAIAGAVLLAIVVIVWQIVSLFSGGSKTAQPKGTTTSAAGSLPNGGPPGSGAGGKAAGGGAINPQPEQLTQQRMSAQQQSDLIKLQQQTQEKYVAALNELQMLKLSQQLAETSKDIATAKLATVTAEKGIVDLLTKPATPVETPASFSPGLATPGLATPGNPLTIQPLSPPSGPPGASVSTTTTTISQDVNYIVISVSQLLNRWSAVVGYQGKLYSVYVGDVLPPDQSTVVSIDKYGVILEKNGVTRKMSLVPII